MKCYWLYMVIILFFFACEEEQDGNKTLVVEGYLYTGVTSQQIKLSSSNRHGTNAEIISDAEVVLYDKTGDYEFMHQRNGIYTYNGEDLLIIPEATYSLEVEYKGQKIYSETTVPHPPVGLMADQDTLTIDGFVSNFITFSWLNPNFYSPLVKSVTAHPDNLIKTNEEIDRFNFSMPTSNNEYFVDIRHIEYLGQNDFILFSVANEYLDLYQFTNQESGLLQPGNIRGGLGIFTSFSSDTVRFYVKAY